MLRVTLMGYDKDGSLVEDEAQEADFVSLFNEETFGPPPLVAPSKDQRDPRAAVGDTVVYVNTRLVPAFVIERVSD